MTNTAIQAIDRFLAANPRFSGSVLIAEEDQVVYEKSFGYVDRTSGVKNTIDTRYCAASAMNKPITAVAVLQLVERNMLTLEDPIEIFFPEYKGSGINVGHLLNHTSGIPNYLMLRKELKWENDYSKADILAKVNEKGVRFSPGAKFSYSNTGYFMAALLIEMITGMPYEQYVADHIFGPAGMDASSFEVNGKPANLAAGHSNGKPVARISPTLLFGCGDVITTAADMHKFDTALHNGTLLLQETMQRMIKPSYQGKFITIGYAWVIKSLFGRDSICHAGTHPSGYISHIERYLKEKLTIIVVGNDMVKHSRLGMKEFAGTYISREIASILFGRKLRFWQKLI